MKTRAEVLRERKAAKEAAASTRVDAKPTAAERTVPLPAAVPGAIAKCGECGAEAEAEKCTVRADGFAECPECGAPVKLSPPKRDPARELKDPHKKWCGQCGSEWPIVENQNGQRFHINCGHMTAERVDDPRKAKKFDPPAGLQTVAQKEVERRNAEDAKAASGKSEEPKPAKPARAAEKGFTPPAAAADPRPAAFGPGPVTVSGNRLSIPWGESRMPVDAYNNFKCGGHIITVEIPEGADRVAVAREIIQDLQQIAELLFRQQKAWYAEKLASLSGN
jgi:hypothetical protein